MASAVRADWKVHVRQTQQYVDCLVNKFDVAFCPRSINFDLLWLYPTYPIINSSVHWIIEYLLLGMLRINLQPLMWLVPNQFIAMQIAYDDPLYTIADGCGLPKHAIVLSVHRIEGLTFVCRVFVAACGEYCSLPSQIACKWYACVISWEMRILFRRTTVLASHPMVFIVHSSFANHKQLHCRTSQQNKQTPINESASSDYVLSDCEKLYPNPAVDIVYTPRSFLCKH